MPIRWRALRRSAGESFVSSCPLTEIEPEVGRSRRLTQRISVLLPAPLGPSTPKISPFSTSRLTPFSAATACPSRPNVLVTSRIEIILFYLTFIKLHQGRVHRTTLRPPPTPSTSEHNHGLLRSRQYRPLVFLLDELLHFRRGEQFHQ